MTAALRAAAANSGPRNDGTRGASRYRHVRWWLALTAVVLGGASAAQTGPGRDLMARLGLSAKTDHFTALSFTTPDALAAPVGDHVVATFSVANHEGTHRDYQWTVSIGEGGDQHPLTSGMSGAADGTTVVVDPALPDLCAVTEGTVPPTRQRITVSLAAPIQSIGYWLTCAPRGTP